MAPIDFDLNNIPDIIEAQITLSYSRLADLIRVIVEQGNSNSNEVDLLHKRLEKLESDNKSLQEQVTFLKEEQKKDVSSEIDDRLSSLLEQVQSLEKKMEEEQLENVQRVRDLESAHMSEKVVLDAQRDRVENQLTQTVVRVDALESTMGLMKAFYTLWEANDTDVLLLAARAAESNSSSVGSSPSSLYLRTLPPIAQLYEEIQGDLQAVQQKSLDEYAANRSKEEDAEEVEDNAASLRDRMIHLEDYIRELGYRVENTSVLAEQVNRLEEMVDGIVVERGSGKDSGPPSPPSSQKLYVADFLPKNPTNASPISQSSPTSAVGSITSCDRPAPHSRSPRVPPARRNLPPLGGSGSAAVPMPPVTSTSGSMRESLHSVSGNPAGEAPPPAMALPGGSGSSSLSAHGQGSSSRRPRISEVLTEQPHVEMLRSISNNPDVELSGTHHSATNSSVHLAGESGPKVNIAYPEEGIRRRVEQLEENIALLEMKKADRSELAVLEEALRQLLIHTALASRNGTDPRADATDPRNMLGAIQLGRPMYTNAAGAMPLRNGNRKTNATINLPGVN